MTFDRVNERLLLGVRIPPPRWQEAPLPLCRDIHFAGLKSPQRQWRGSKHCRLAKGMHAQGCANNLRQVRWPKAAALQPPCRAPPSLSSRQHCIYFSRQRRVNGVRWAGTLQWLVLLVVVLWADLPTVTTTAPLSTAERAALVDLWSSVSGLSAAHPNWASGDPCFNSWVGVFCSTAPVAVTYVHRNLDDVGCSSFSCPLDDSLCRWSPVLPMFTSHKLRSHSPFTLPLAVVVDELCRNGCSRIAHRCPHVLPTRCAMFWCRRRAVGAGASSCPD